MTENQIQAGTKTTPLPKEEWTADNQTILTNPNPSPTGRDKRTFKTHDEVMKQLKEQEPTLYQEIQEEIKTGKDEIDIEKYDYTFCPNCIDGGLYLMKQLARKEQALRKIGELASKAINTNVNDFENSFIGMIDYIKQINKQIQALTKEGE